jgi:geranylgeranyl diphosphate synthase type II
MSYSLHNGGKRFRPQLCLTLAETFGVSPQKILPWAAAVEMVHTYSLIHDDLPCMDDDDERRGQPTNHKKFGEATALLAGDALLTEAFYTISISYQDHPKVGLKLTQILAEAAGAFGMVGGQILDLATKNKKIGFTEMSTIHALKTGALIRSCTEGTAVVCGLPEDKVQLCKAFGENLGLSFQLKDDLLDASMGTTEMGMQTQEIEAYLAKISGLAIENLEQLEIVNGPLVEMVTYNQQRQK